MWNAVGTAQLQTHADTHITYGFMFSKLTFGVVHLLSSSRRNPLQFSIFAMVFVATSPLRRRSFFNFRTRIDTTPLHLRALTFPEISLPFFSSIFHFSFHTVELVVAALPDIYAERTLEFVSKQITASHHIEFYLNWSTNLLTIHAAKENVFKHQSLLATQDALTRKYEALSKVCDFNKYTLKVLIEMADATEATENSNGAGENDDDEDMENDSDESNLMLIRRANDDDTDLAASDEVMSDDSD